MWFRVMAVLITFASSTALAGEWKGEAGAGLLTTSGNSETQSLNGSFVLEFLAKPWKNTFSASGINNGDEEGRTAERYAVGNKTDWDFTERDYIFLSLEWEKDLFGGIRERTSETAGYGRHVLTGPAHLLDTEIGVGARQTEEQDTGIEEEEVIGRLSGKYQWLISDTSTFSQNLKVEHGSSNTFTEAVTALKLSIIGNLFAKISFTARNNTDVPADTKKTDTETAISLSYAFKL